MERVEQLRQDEVLATDAVLSLSKAAEAEQPFEEVLEQMLAEQKSEPVPQGGTVHLSSDDELDELNRKLNEMIDSL